MQLVEYHADTLESLTILFTRKGHLALPAEDEEQMFTIFTGRIAMIWSQYGLVGCWV